MDNKSLKAVTDEGASGNPTTTTVPAVSLPQSRQRVIQNFLLIWLDANFNEADSDFQKSIKALRQIVMFINVFTNPQECIDFLSTVKKEKVFLIVSGSLGQRIVPEIESLPQMESIYVFCGNKAAHEEWAKKIAKVKGVYTDIDPICEVLKVDRRTCDRNMVSISLNRVDPQFMYTQLLKDAILQIEDDDDKEIKKLVDFCQQQDDIDSTQIKQVRSEYRQHTPIWWYTADTFMYSVLNRGLREMNTDIVLSMQFFIRHLHQQIAELYKEQQRTPLSSSSKTKGKFTVYRGQGLSTEVLEKLKSTRGKLMSFNNFLSTSLDRQVSLEFANQTNGDMVGILFVMAIDSTVAETSNIPYADVSKVGFYEGKEAEILFTTHTIFCINHIQQVTDDQPNRLWEVQLTLVGKDDNELNELMTHVKSEIKGESWHRLGWILIKMGEPEKAKQLYKELLGRATGERARSAYLHQMGWVYGVLGEYSKAVEYYDESLEIKKKIFPLNHSDFVMSYNNIGNMYGNIGDYSKALEYYQKSFEIQNKALSQNHPALASSYNNIGNVYRHMGEYSKSLEYYQKSVAIKSEVLPSNHPDLAVSYNNIGNVYRNMGEYSTALEYYQKSHEIQKIVLPSNHSSLASSYNNIGNVYRNMGEYSKALEYYQKSLDMRKIALPPDHPDLAVSYMNVGNVYQHVGEYSKSLEYYQKSLAIKSKVLPPNNPDLAVSYNKIGNVYRNMGEYSTALEYYQKSQEIQKIVLPPNHSSLASSYNNIGLTYKKLNDYQKALSYYEKLLEICEESLPCDHPCVGQVKRNIEEVKSKI